MLREGEIGLTFVFVVVAFALGVHAVGTTGGNGRSGRGGRNNSSDDAEFSGPQADFHHRFGLAVFILVVIQSLLGLASHYTRGPDLANPRSRAVPSLTAKRSLVRYLHVVLGVAVMTMLYVQTADGVTHEWDQRVNNGTVVPSAVKIVFWTLVGVEVGLWVLGLAVEPVRNRMKRRSGRDGKRGGKEAGRKEIKRVPPPARTSTDRTL